MIKAVNMKNFKFKATSFGSVMYRGFGMLDTETNSFVSFDGVHPYVLKSKKIIQSCIDGNWPETLERVDYSIKVGA